MHFHKRVRRSFRWTVFIAALVSGCLFCSLAQAGPKTDKVPYRGNIRISGAWALYPMMVTWAEEFKKIHPGVRIDVSAGGAGKGVADALSGLVDIGMVSRELRPEERRQQVFYVAVVKDAVFPTVNRKNPALQVLLAKGLKKKALQDLWISGRPLTWGELSGTAGRQKVRVYTRSDSCGAAETWAKYLGANQEDLKGVAVYGDPGVAEAVRRDLTGIGYNNLNYAYDMKTGRPLPGLAVAPIDVNENGRVDPGETLSTKKEAMSAVQSGRYPSPPARDLYLVTRESFKSPAKEFVRWILTDGQKYVDEVGYLKIGGKQLAEALEKMGR
ncbi:MAG: substrate-binding domain-containing protein [Syntrophaceae bacterium]|nr:substrate-binding domain-containing protein [Syntrophaceae bacterium]